MKDFEASIKLVNKSVERGILSYISKKRYRFISINNPEFAFEFEEVIFHEGLPTQLIYVGKPITADFFPDDYLQQLKTQLLWNEMPSE